MNNDVAVLKRSLFYPKTDLDVDKEFFSELRFIRNELIELYSDKVRDLACQFFQKSVVQVLPVTGGGTFHLVYQVAINTERYIIKIMLPELPLHGAAFLIDRWVYKVLKSNGLPSLEVYSVDFSQRLFPFCYEIVEYAPGIVLTDIQDKETQYLPESILESLGAYMARVHEIKIDGCGPLMVTQSSDNSLTARGVHHFWTDYIFCHLNKHIAVCTDLGALSFEEAERVRNLFMDYASLFSNTQGVLLHGDLGSHNLFSDGKRITAIIDWEDCMSGDPLFDIAYWGTFFKDYMRDELLLGYKKYAQLPTDFELRYWLYYLRIALSKTVHRHRFGYTDHPKRPAASMRIQKALMYLRLLGA